MFVEDFEKNQVVFKNSDQCNDIANASCDGVVSTTTGNSMVGDNS